MNPETRETVRPITVVRHGRGAVRRADDVAAAEEPMEVRVHGESFAVIMRTPGADLELAAGFLFAERVILSGAELGTIRYCLDAKEPNLRNVLDVTLTIPDWRARIGDRRRVVMNSSCGLCGRVALDRLRAEAPPIASSLTVPADLIAALPDRLRAAQPTFDETGGLHGAGLFDAAGALETAAEDVGRHNAVDKVIGRMLMGDRLPLGASILTVSGRTSFEIVQKAFLAGIPVLVAVSAPSSLAIDLARECGVTLLGFVRGGSFNVYTHEHRIVSAP
jgi:FdhD protein